MGYNRVLHRELGCTPVDRFAADNNRHRPCPSAEKLSLAFTRQITRKPRRHDATLSLNGVRYEIPWQYAHLKQQYVRYREWDLSRAWLMDENAEKVITTIHPVDKQKNAGGQRRLVNPVPEPSASSPRDETAPLLKKMMEDYAATGLPSPWIPPINLNGDEN